MIRTLLMPALLLGACSPGAAQAPWLQRLHRLLNGDSAQAIDYDTAYVRSYRDDLVVSPVITNQGSDLTLTLANGDAVRYATNTASQHGLALDYKWLGIEFTTTLSGLGTLDADRGLTETTGLGFGYTGRRWWFRNSLRWSRGYHVENPAAVDPQWTAGSPYPHRNDLESTTYMVGLNHGFNAERYSQAAALWQMERQKRSAGSLIAGGAFWYTRTAAEKPLLPANVRGASEAVARLTGIRRMTWCITGGYAHTLALWQRGFINLMVVPGLGAQQQRLFSGEDQPLATGWDLAVTLEVRCGAGYVGDRWYAALSVVSYQSAGSIDPEVVLGNGFASARLAAGYRIKGLRPLLPALGL